MTVPFVADLLICFESSWESYRILLAEGMVVVVVEGSTVVVAED